MSEMFLKPSAPLRPLVRRADILLTEDDKLRAYANFPTEKYVPKCANDQVAFDDSSLLDLCERGKKNKTKVLTFFHDHFFGGGERELHLMHPEFIDCAEKISKFTESYGIGIGASVTNPLDLGRNFKDVMGVGGQHRVFAEGILNEDGSFDFISTLPECWGNNKGLIYPKLNKVRLFTYTEEYDMLPYIVISPDSICEIPEDSYSYTQSSEDWELAKYLGKSHLNIKGKTSLPGNRVFAVLHMDLPEMDYFHPEAKKYVHDIIDTYLERGVEFLELYSDEMHIQFDWDLGSHFGPHEIPTRYMTKNFENKLSEVDPFFSDFDKALIYFGYDMYTDRKALGKSHTQHIMGKTHADMYRTFNLRRTYFEMLQTTVVDICCDARDYIRDTYKKNEGWDPICFGHATWQESPTCDRYSDNGTLGMHNNATIMGVCAYDYTPDYCYSSTIREAISACYDYFKWNDYFSYGGTDMCECGWFDRNYYGGALSASLGSLNRNEITAWGSWGFPDEVRKRFSCVQNSFGSFTPVEGIVSWYRPRDIDVLYVYPKDLTMIEERFGSWMVQYGYTNYCPADRIVNLGKVKDGKLSLGLCNYSTIVVGFEPFYNPEFVALLKEFIMGGGNVVWNSAPPADINGVIPSDWLELFGIKTCARVTEGKTAYKINFAGALYGIDDMKIPTDMLPDKVYNITLDSTSEGVAYAHGMLVGAHKTYGAGKATYLGFRLRDDQTGETDDSPSTLFDVLKRLGAYGGDSNTDSPETISRKSEYFVTKFPNGTYSFCRHYRTMRELWPDGRFMRNKEADNEFLKTYKYMVPLELDIENMSIDGKCVSYHGKGFCQYRFDDDGNLCGFKGDNTTGITIDGKEYSLTENKANTVFSKLEDCRLPDGYSEGWIICSDADKVNICNNIPDTAEFYLNPDLVINQLLPAPDVYANGSTIYKGNNNIVVILIK